MMRKKCFRLVLCLVITLFVNRETLYAQDSVSLNLIIMVNDVLPISNLANVRVGFEQAHNDTQVLYYPGLLMLDTSGLSGIQEDLVLKLDYYEYQGKKQIVRSFKVPFDVRWNNLDYLVLRIYDLDIKKYRKRYSPISLDQNYTYSLDYPGGQMLRITDK